jgi:hypothetical protein
MITKQQFIAAVQEHERVAARWAKIVGFFLAGLIFGLAALDYAKSSGYLAWLGTTDPSGVFAVLWCVGLLVVVGLQIARTWRCRVLCPLCKKQLVQFSARIAVATGVCSYCGEKIFEQSFKQA